MKMPLLSKMFAEIIATIAASAILPARASTFTVGGSGNTFTISRSGAGVADPQDEKSTFRIASFPMKAGGGSPETPRPSMQFFKAVLFGDTDAD